MKELYSRTYGIFGPDIEKIKSAKVAVVGLGGVGGEAAVALARSGIGSLVLIDGDHVVESNLNRQAVAFRSTLGMNKARACARLLEDINPDCVLTLHEDFWAEGSPDLSDCDIILDCIDNVKNKVELISYAKKKGVWSISAMGAGNKVCPEMFKVGDISKTSVDPLSRVMRRRLHKLGIDHVNVVWSDEIPRTPFERPDEEDEGRYQKTLPPASSSFTPPAMGLIMAAEAIKHIVSGD